MLRLVLSIVGFCCLSPALASELLDRQYAFRSVFSFLVENQKYPVYSEAVERAMAKVLRESPRFEFSDTGFVWTKENLKPIAEMYTGKPLTAATLPMLRPTFDELASKGIDSVIVAQLRAVEPAQYELVAHFVNLANGQVIHSASGLVPEGATLDLFAEVARDATKQLVNRIPFEANIISRDGYRVILDQGASKFRRGMRVQAVTIEGGDEEALTFRETGIIQIQHADRSLAFGKIVVENVPSRVNAANKIRSMLQETPEKITPAPAVLNRQVASAPSLADEPTAASTANTTVVGEGRGRIGWVEAGLAPSLFSLSETATRRADDIQGNGTLLLSLRLRSEIWITRSVFSELSLQYAKGAIEPVNFAESTSASYTAWRLLAGYRYFFSASERGPSIYAKGGYASTSYGFTEVQPTAALPAVPNNFSMGGIWMGGGGRYPLSDENGLELELGTLLLGGFSEDPYTSGADITAKANYELALRYYHRYQANLDVSAALILNSASGEFSGRGTRPGGTYTGRKASNSMLYLSAVYGF